MKSVDTKYGVESEGFVFIKERMFLASHMKGEGAS